MEEMTKIKYGDKEYYISAIVEYDGTKYYFIIENVYRPGMPDLDKLEDDLLVETRFIYKDHDDMYKTVLEKELLNKLKKLVSIDYLAGNNKFISPIDEEN